jgi:serum/glucocorticoid-regulated kinase 2
MEIVDLHQKLRDSYPVAKLPALPIDISTLPAPPAKRKSNFLNTLSRLASPSSNRSARQASNRHIPGSLSAIPSTLPTPLVSPSHDGPDPFASFSAATNGLDSSTLTSGTHANSTVTGLASYLTSISNEPTLRQARHWKRFVRVRPDDLESVRVERAIKRVRSDLASHVSPKSPEVHVSKGHISSTNVSVVDSHEDSGIVNGDTGPNLQADGITEEEEEAADANVHEADTMTVEGQTGHDVVPGEEAETFLAPIDVSASTSQAMEEDVSTPMPPDMPAARIPRSQSADPDKATRLSRVYTNQEGASSQTGDESSISTTAGDSSGRKKRSRSSDPKRELKKSQRKVVVDDFEMLRVLGKGCAGKVLLVRHKSTTDLYALKAITKRHVLAHQELQHTLTEQAVLKRMAAESKDPFVVKLWWSFHDKENLFLVMVSDIHQIQISVFTSWILVGFSSGR